MSSYVTRKTPGDTAWFTHDRFGMFIHWGLYAMPARHEWVKNHECIPEDRYDLYFKHFNPDLFDPKEWARQAKAAGMKYAVLTTKHHEGFCLFDSQYTDYKSTNTPAGRDLVRAYVDAFRAEGLRVGFYYSLIDWHHPDFTTRMPLNRTKAGICGNMRNTCAIRCVNCSQTTEKLTSSGSTFHTAKETSRATRHG